MADYVKLHTDALDNRKIQTIPPTLALPWLNFLLLSRINGGVLPDVADMAFRLRTDQVTVSGWLTALRKLRLIDQSGERGDFVMHDWDDWNPPRLDRTNAERQARHRAKKRNAVTPPSALPSEEIQERKHPPTILTVTPLRNDPLLPLRNGVTDGVVEWPLSSIEIRQHFPAASDLEVLAVVQECGQACISIGEEPPDDDDIAEAVKLSHFNGQENVRAYRKRAPQVIKTWIERRKHREQTQRNGK